MTLDTSLIILALETLREQVLREVDAPDGRLNKIHSQIQLIKNL